MQAARGQGADLEAAQGLQGLQQLDRQATSLALGIGVDEGAVVGLGGEAQLHAPGQCRPGQQP